jgi:ATP-dependent Zn protease
MPSDHGTPPISDDVLQATAAGALEPLPGGPDTVRLDRADADVLASQWRRLNRFATAIAVLTSPALFLSLRADGYARLPALAVTVLGIAAFRGLIDVFARRLIPWPSLFGAESKALEEDVVSRRRAWFWKRLYRVVFAILVFVGFFWLLDILRNQPASFTATAQWIWHGMTSVVSGGMLLQLPLFLVFNIVILMGPFLFMAVRQIRGYEPGDADWGVQLADVRGQAEAKTEVSRIINLWQAGDAFEQAGGKRERGILFLGPPGTGKTMLAKAIATGFNAPFITIPGSGFAQTFIGMDILAVQWLAFKAKRLAAKWGGQCIVFIDEIDAVGMRRASLGGVGAVGAAQPPRPSIHDYCWHGPQGSLSSTCGLVVETREWRERQFAQRAEPAPSGGLLGSVSGAVNRYVMPGGMGMGGGGALNQLLVVMDGIDDPPMMRRFVTNKTNTILDALYVVPRRIGRLSLRLPRPRPAGNQIYFIGACNVPIEALDPALTRPGRMGRHVRFRTPLKDDRTDIFEHYLGKVAHVPELDAPERRDELARMTNGYSPAMIEQVCSMALTRAHHDGRAEFDRADIVEAMTTVESGTAVNVQYVERETRSVAIHEAGHAAAGHVYCANHESTRLTIRMRGASLGHYQRTAKEERFSEFKSEKFADLVTTMGAIAAEHVFYGENSDGVGGDMAAAATQAALMVGASAMGPMQIDLGGRFRSDKEEEARRARVLERCEQIGQSLIAVATVPDPWQKVLFDRDKRRVAAQILGQAYLVAYLFVLQNREAIDRIADELVERRELYGDEVIELLQSVELRPATVDYDEEWTWPRR